MSTSMLNSFADHKSEDSEDYDDIKSDNEEITKNKIDGKNDKDEDIEKELHTKPLDVSIKFPGKENNHRNPNLNKQDNFHDDDDDDEVNNESSINLEDPFDNKDIILDAVDTDLPDANSLSNVLVSPLPSNHKKGLFRRAYSDPPATNERTPLTSSSSDGSNNTVNKMRGYKSFNKSISTPEDTETPSSSGRNNLLESTEEEEGDRTKQTFKSLASFATLTKWWKKNADSKKKKRDKIEEKKMRLKLQYHFMTPFEKYKLGRKPWKLGVQILKILVVTTQVQ